MPKRLAPTRRRLGAIAGVSPLGLASREEFDLPKEHNGADPPFYEEATSPIDQTVNRLRILVADYSTPRRPSSVSYCFRRCGASSSWS